MTDESNPTEENPAAAGAEAKAQGPVFAIKRIFVRDISFEVPGNVDIFSKPWKPQVSQDLNTEVDTAGENHFLVTLKMTITVKLEDKVAYLAEVHQAGIFQVSGLPDEQIKQALTVQCPTILYPYVREAIDNMTVRGGFPPLSIPPINFEAIVARASAEAQAKAAAESS